MKTQVLPVNEQSIRQAAELLRAGELIRSGQPVMKAAEQAGFQDYSTFLRAFRNTFHTSPREFYSRGEKRSLFHDAHVD